MKIRVRTEESYEEVEAVVRKSGLAVHPCEPSTWMGSKSSYGKKTNHQTITYITRFAITHIESGTLIANAFSEALALKMCAMLEKAGCDWKLPAPELMKFEGLSTFVDAVSAWHSTQMFTLSKMGVNLKAEPETTT